MADPNKSPDSQEKWSAIVARISKEPGWMRRATMRNLDAGKRVMRRMEDLNRRVSEAETGRRTQT